MADRCIRRGARPPNPSFVTTSSVVTLSVDTGPLPDVRPTKFCDGTTSSVVDVGVGVGVGKGRRRRLPRRLRPL